MLAPAILAPAPVVWYGPKTVSFSLPVATGNPYDPVQNDVSVQFQGPKGVTERRLAYFDGEVWKATLLAREKGTFRPVVFRNGAKGQALAPIALTAIKPHGFVRLGGLENFRMDDGTAYWPLGHNLAWASGPVQDLPAYLRQMGADGLNWARIWADHWDDKNPYWPTKAPMPKPEEMSPAVLRNWDAIVDAADASGVRFQMTMFHHGPWTTHSDTNWADNPWNAKNGGWLKAPADFFTDAKAKALSRAWLRYAVARWGHSPSIMAWELFNEVQWTNPFYENKGETVGTWHDEMADYVRSIDPYHHLITTSSDLSLPIYRRVDYYQPHTYPPSVEAAIAAAPKLDKPLFFGEFGPGQLDGSRPVQVQAIRDGVWAALLTLQAGAGQYWSWDRIPTQNLRGEFQRTAALVKEIGPDRTGFKVQKLDLDAGMGGDLAVMPGGGWETSRQFAFNLPDDAQKLGLLSGYLQGNAHPEMRPQPVGFTFTTPKATRATVEVTGASTSGGNLALDLDGIKGATVSFAPGAKFDKPTVVGVEIPAGTHTLVLRNDGPDWVMLGHIRIAGISPRATARAITDGKRAVLRVQGEGGLSIALKGLGLPDGRYRAHVADLDGADTYVPLTVKNGDAGRMTLPGKDTVVIVR